MKTRKFQIETKKKTLTSTNLVNMFPKPTKEKKLEKYVKRM